MRRWAPLLALCGCAVGDGGWLVTLEPQTVSATLVGPEERFGRDGWLLTREGYELRFMELRLGLGPLSLRDGDAVLATLPVLAEVPVAVRTPLGPIGGAPLGPCQPRCGLEEATIGAAALGITGLHAEGLVRDGSGRRRLEDPTPLAIALDLPAQPAGDAPSEAPLTAAVGARLSRRTPAALTLSAAIEIEAGLGDGVEWAALPRQGGALCLGAAACSDAGAAALLRDALAGAQLRIDLRDADE